MPIKFLNVPGSTNLRTSRPTGYKFPVGLNAVIAGPTSVDYLVVAGGGGGGSYGGGGGAGGFRTAAGFSIATETSYSITVGGGGPGANGSPDTGIATKGSNSEFSSITSEGGGRGATGGTNAGGSGGSGGGVIDGIKKGGIGGILGMFISKIGLSSGGFISES